jgi:hypothetical protein
LKGNFGTIRTVCNKPDLSDVECLALSLQELLSINSKRIIDKAVKRWKWLRELSSTIMPRVIASGKTGIDFGGSVLGRLVAYEVRRLKRRAATELSEDATSEIFSNWLLLREYDMGGHMQILRTIAKRFAGAFFTAEQLVQIKAEPNAPASETIVSGVMTTAIKPFCYFASCIWEALQEDENPLSTRDAYALGVIDEVYDSGLPCLRDTMESQTPQQPNLPMPSSSGPAPPSVQS